MGGVIVPLHLIRWVTVVRFTFYVYCYTPTVLHVTVFTDGEYVAG